MHCPCTNRRKKHLCVWVLRYLVGMVGVCGSCENSHQSQKRPCLYRTPTIPTVGSCCRGNVWSWFVSSWWSSIVSENIFHVAIFSLYDESSGVKRLFEWDMMTWHAPFIESWTERRCNPLLPYIKDRTERKTPSRTCNDTPDSIQIDYSQLKCRTQLHY